MLGPEKHCERPGVCHENKRGRPIYRQGAGPNPLDHRDDSVDRPRTMGFPPPQVSRIKISCFSRVEQQVCSGDVPRSASKKRWRPENQTIHTKDMVLLNC